MTRDDLFDRLTAYVPNSTDLVRIATAADLKSLYWRTVFQALLKPHSTRRRSLPPELADRIMFFVNCTYEAPPSAAATSVIARGRAGAGDSELVKEAWFRSPPIDEDMLRWGAKIQLCTGTISPDQGWCSPPCIWEDSWSWFELAVIRRSTGSDAPSDSKFNSNTELEVVADVGIVPTDGARDDRTSLSTSTSNGQSAASEEFTIGEWKSHHNIFASPGHLGHRGLEFHREHELWTFLQVGDFIEVRACAAHRLWETKGEGGSLRFWRFYNSLKDFQ